MMFIFTLITSISCLDLLQSLGTTSPYPASDYSPLPGLVSVHMFTRHGARYPTESKFKNHLEVMAIINKSIDLGYGDSSNAGLLHPSGFLSIKRFANRFRNRYASIDLFRNGMFASTSNDTRVIQTATTFFESIGVQAEIGVIGNRSLDADNDMIKSCLQYTRLETDDSHAKEFEKTYLSALTKRVNEELRMNLTTKQVSSLQDACAFQLAYGRLKLSDSFCGLFTANDFESYQKLDGLEKFYKLSYGLQKPYDRNLACSAVTGLVNQIDKEQASFNFGHAETIIPILSSLNLFKDQGPAAGDTLFQTSIISPFQSNLIFEVYSDVSSGKQIRLMLNENVIAIPTCSSGPDMLCPLQKFLKNYQEIIGCDFDMICGNPYQSIGGSNQIARGLNADSDGTKLGKMSDLSPIL